MQIKNNDFGVRYFWQQYLQMENISTMKFSRTMELLKHWVQMCHQENKWNYNPLKKGSFGYDNIVVSLVKFFSKTSTSSDENDAIHQGWQENYIYWRDNKPFLPLNISLYTKPAKSLGDERRDMCAVTTYKDLPEDEKEKDLIFVKAVNHICK